MKGSSYNSEQVLSPVLKYSTLEEHSYSTSHVASKEVGDITMSKLSSCAVQLS